jgi:hypothetical protein
LATRRLSKASHPNGALFQIRPCWPISVSASVVRSAISALSSSPKHRADLRHGAPMGSSEIDLLGDGHQPHLAGTEALEQGKLLRGVAAQPVHAHHDNGISTRTAGLQ